MGTPGVDVVLFDLGGVLIELGGVGALQGWAGINGDAEILEQWLTSPWVRRFESGNCTAVEFSEGVVSEWGLPVSPGRFLEAFRAWPVGPFEGAADLLHAVRRRTRIGCLSNTNVVHWEHQVEQWPILGLFDYRFLSFDLGLVKPDPAVYREVSELLSAPSDRVLFLDDNRLNIEAARSHGFRSEQVRGVAEAGRALIEAGVIDAGDLASGFPWAADGSSADPAPTRGPAVRPGPPSYRVDPADPDDVGTAVGADDRAQGPDAE